jgi:hypothetical protein
MTAGKYANANLHMPSLVSCTEECALFDEYKKRCGLGNNLLIEGYEQEPFEPK